MKKNVISIMSLLLMSLLLMCATLLISCNLPIWNTCKHEDPNQIVTLEAVSATCSTTGLTEGKKCNLCGEIVVPQETVPLNEEHTFGEWETVMEATQTKPGFKTRNCQYCDYFENEDIEYVPEEYDYEITLWVSPALGVKEFIEKQVNEFKAAHPEYKIKINIDVVSEGLAGGNVLNGVGGKPDVFCITQEYIPQLAMNGNLAPLSEQVSIIVKTNNDASSVSAATMDDQIYAYPMATDNGYFLYYDSSIVSDEEAKTLEGIITACEKAGKKFGCNLLNGWYTVSFFFARSIGEDTPLCSSSWMPSIDGRIFTDVYDTFNSANGLIAMKAMNKLMSSKAWVNTDYQFSNTGAMISGLWGVGSAEQTYGDNLKATKLPTFTVEGQTYQMGSFSGHKYIGCKPQEDPQKAKICEELALYLTSEKAQLERFNGLRAYGLEVMMPSNKNLQDNAEVNSNMFVSALIQQNRYSVPQGVYHYEWWSEVTDLATLCKDSEITDEDIRAALEAYEKKINALVNN